MGMLSLVTVPISRRVSVVGRMEISRTLKSRINISAQKSLFQSLTHLCDEGGHGVHARSRGVVHQRAVLEVDSHLPLVHLQFHPEELNDSFSVLLSHARLLLQVPLDIGFFFLFLFSNGCKYGFNPLLVAMCQMKRLHISLLT